MIVRRFVRWLFGWRRCSFCGLMKPPRELSIGVDSGDGVQDFCVECLLKRYGEIGQKVTYVSFGKEEPGIVKSLSDSDHVFVVYHCGGNWDRYFDYTAARTRVSDLRLGWSSEASSEADNG